VAARVSDLVLPVRVDPAGETGPTRGRAAGPGWRRTGPGLFVPASVSDELVEQRIVEATGLAPARAVVTGWASLRLQGGGFFDGLARDGRTRLPVPLSANGARFAASPAVLRTRDVVPPDEVTVIHGVRVATVARALFDEMRRQPGLREAAVAASMACAARLTSVRRMEAYCVGRRGHRDVRRVRDALTLAVEGARSPQEARFGLLWELDAGWGRPLLNRVVLDLDGRKVATPDLLDVERGVVGEYAGADHRDIDRHERDIAREAALRAVGLEYVEVVGRDLRRTARAVERMRQAEARVVVGPRRWKLAPPGPSLDEVLDRRDAAE
jgi:hypothetical protein